MPRNATLNPSTPLVNAVGLRLEHHLTQIGIYENILSEVYQAKRAEQLALKILADKANGGKPVQERLSRVMNSIMGTPKLYAKLQRNLPPFKALGHLQYRRARVTVENLEILRDFLHEIVPGYTPPTKLLLPPLPPEVVAEAKEANEELVLG